MFLLELLYSVNDNKFYYEAEKEDGSIVKVCLTKKQHLKYEIDKIESDEGPATWETVNELLYKKNKKNP